MSTFDQSAAPAPSRYAKDQILSVFSGSNSGMAFASDPASHLYMDGWAPGTSNGSASASLGLGVGARQWGKPSESAAAHDPDMCWLQGQSDFKPLGLQDLTQEEKEVQLPFAPRHHGCQKRSPEKKKKATRSGYQRKEKKGHKSNGRQK